MSSEHDRSCRQQALDAGRSFIVQAPAGSGKTELLVQRFLALLTTVEQPEEILAMTFTRKAAAEMRGRILRALTAVNDNIPDSEPERARWSLAQAAIKRDRARGWELARNPLRIQVMTIDSFCAQLAMRLPWSSRLGAGPVIREDCSALYCKAAEAAVELVEGDTPYAEAMAVLLRTLDGNQQAAITLIAQLLAKREQWLSLIHFGRGDKAELLEKAWGEEVSEQLNELSCSLRQHCSPETLSQWMACAHYAGDQFLKAGKTHPARSCIGLVSLPPVTVSSLEAWRGLAALVLTGENRLRKTVNISSGFPTPDNGGDEKIKALMEQLLGVLSELDSPQLVKLLGRVNRLPSMDFANSHHQVLSAITTVLYVASAKLMLVFKAEGATDFIEITHRANRALGDEASPTDLALVLDQGLNHLLIDEFQDTSRRHMALLEKLTVNWGAEEGRTLFVVGDPMQSIYRFREADVAHFLRVTTEGLAGLRLELLILEANFRSSLGVVEWVNRVFSRILPKESDPFRGAVTYSPAIAQPSKGPDGEVIFNPLLDSDARAEADLLVNHVEIELNQDKLINVAILGATRAHLAAIIAELRNRGIPFMALENEPLQRCSEVQDLLCLTRVLVHPGDRGSWLALLRAPFIGLSLSDLTMLGEVKTGLFTQILQNVLNSAADGAPERDRATLSAEGRRRLQRSAPLLLKAGEEIGRHALARQVEGVWAALGGPALLNDTQMANARAYLDLLADESRNSPFPDLAQLHQRVARLWAEIDLNAGDRLQLMTIHKAKGLEFDVVFLPRLGSQGRNEERQLLRWSGREGETPLMAPVVAAEEGTDSYNTFLKELDRDRLDNERDRLLYVASTRARQKLYLYGHTSVDSEGEIKPPPVSSLLARLWPALAGEFSQSVMAKPASGDRETSPHRTKLFRTVDPAWTPPPPRPAIAFPPGGRPSRGERPEFIWVGEAARHVGSVVHEMLAHIAAEGAAAWPVSRRQQWRSSWRGRLTELGLRREELDQAVSGVEMAVNRSCEDPRGQWILDNSHQEAWSEWDLTGVEDGTLHRIRIDRSFIDNQQRWIIDYKTSDHQGGDVEGFLDQEQRRYTPQLERYATLVAKWDNRPISLGLYYPLLGGWRCWQWSNNELS